MDRFLEELKQAFTSILDFARQTKDAYEGSGRFAKMRLWIVGAVALDLAVTLTLVLAAGSQVFDIEVWYQKAFPSNVLIVRHNGRRPLRDLTMVLDQRYSSWIDRLEPGLKGFELRGDFHDAQGLAPGDDYRPRLLQVKNKDGEMVIPVLDRPD